MIAKVKQHKYYKKWIEPYPEVWPALLVLPISSILAVIVWLTIRWRTKNSEHNE